MDAWEERHLKGAGKIEEVFQNGFSLDSKVLHYIDSTFSNPSATEIEKILTGESDFEKETLLKLIFFPDESIQFHLEEFLEQADISKEDAGRITGYLSAREIQTKIIFPDERGTIKVTVPPVVLGECIDRLNMHRKLHDKLAKAVKCIAGDRSRTLAKVKIRNARKEYVGTSLDFLCLFFEKMGPEEESIFGECFELVVEVLCEAGNDADIYSALLCKKAASYQSLLSAERFEEQLEKSNIETLLLQGVRPVSIDKDAAMRNMEIVDRICLAVFGKTEYYEKSRIFPGKP
jgi:hypothetical protein